MKRKSLESTNALWRRLICQGLPGYKLSEVKKHPITKEILSSDVLNGKVADFGCGIGVRTSFLSTFNSDIVGIDYSKVALDYARKRFPDIYFVESDLLCLPFDDDFFDNGLLVATIEHVPDTDKLLSELTRVTKDRIFISVTENDYHGAKTHCHSFTNEKLKMILESHFELEQIETKSHIIFAQVKI